MRFPCAQENCPEVSTADVRKNDPSCGILLYFSASHLSEAGDAGATVEQLTSWSEAGAVQQCFV